ncbi:MAG: MFS transporter [Propionibacteriaceae bacterium]|jgi:MFS family permease|nr:MFS transporter [Propionibacteriaceae bacterium]
MTEDAPAGGWRRFAIAAYGPPFLASIGFGAVTPLIALSALALGASVGLSALIAGLTAIAQLLSDLPASWIATRLGEKRAIIAACLWDAVFMTVAFSAFSLPVLCVAVFAIGISGAVFGLARHTYITEAAPVRFRARALSTLGGIHRIGFFIGPLAGSAIIALAGLTAAYAFAAVMCLVAAGVTALLPDLPADVRERRRTPEGAPRLGAVLRDHARIFALLGTGVLALALVRAVRQTILPLWCESIGMTPSATSLIFALSMAVDMSLFFVGGSIMDRFGRFWVATPSMIVLGGGLIALAFAHTTVTVALVAILLGLGNGIGSGIIMTLGSDASPAAGRPHFLAGWRLMGDLGGTLGPLALSAITTLASLAAASVVLGIVSFAGAAWLGYGITHAGSAPQRGADRLPRSAP